MGKKEKRLKDQTYEDDLRLLQIELVKLQRHVIAQGERLLVIFEGRDGSGKDGTIKRFNEHLSPRESRMVALGKPTERERGSWYFQRYAAHLPAEGEIVLFNRSWYNRAGVEKVMGFCTNAEYKSFLVSVIPFESMLQDAGIRILKYYLDITRAEQKERLDERRKDPLKQWKMSPIDAKAMDLFDDYTKARDRMLDETSSPSSPWYVIDANVKKTARLNVIRHVLAQSAYEDKDEDLARHDPEIVFPFDETAKEKGRLAP